MKNLKTYVLGMALMAGIPLFAGNEAQAGETFGIKDKKTAGDVVTGTVVDECGQLVKGVVVTGNNVVKSVKTNGKGVFKINAGENDTLIFKAPVKETLRVAVKDIHPRKKIEMKWLQSESDQTVIVGLDLMPKFPYGEVSRWLSQNIQYPEKAKKERREGKVLVQFIIEKDGRVSNAHVLCGGSNPDLEHEAVRVVQMMPNWQPGIKNGRTVRVSYTVPVNFRLR